MRPIHRSVFIALGIAIILAGAVEGRAQTCPTRPPGYWQGVFCIGATVTLPSGPCLMEICYCYHVRDPNIFADTTEFYIFSLREEIPGCFGGTSSFILLTEARLTLVQVETGGGGISHEDCVTPPYKIVKVTSPLCFHHPTIEGTYRLSIWSKCEHSGECVHIYKVNCTDNSDRHLVRTWTDGMCDNLGKDLGGHDQGDCQPMCDQSR